jgi:hypothetical protein
MARRNPNPAPSPSTRTLLVIVLLVSLSVAWAGREHLATLDAGFLWGPSGAPCTATGPLAGVMANAAGDLASCASVARPAALGGDAAAGFALAERPAPRLTR